MSKSKNKDIIRNSSQASYNRNSSFPSEKRHDKDRVIRIYTEIRKAAKNKTSVNILKILIGAALFLYVMFTVDFSALASIRLTSNLILFLAIGFIDTLFIVFLLGLRWRYVLGKFFNYKISLKRSVEVSFIAKFFSILTPSRIGDVVRARYVPELGMLRAVSSVIMDRIIEMTALVFMALLAVLYFKNIPVGFIQINAMLIIAVIVMAAVMSYVLKNRIYKLKKRIFVRQLNKTALCVATGISFVIWIFTMLQIYVMALALGISPNIIDVVLISVIITFIELIPITIASVGLREWTGANILPLIGIAAAAGLLISWLVMITLTIFPAVIGYIVLLRSKDSSEAVGKKG
ncbi:MAG: flippase-like domain-containing protein [Candidatus Aenigmarchaeota archaeon]|nr:flippase-like domain-containing protein [Candidatus Aenigmarchaeota archaeon]